MDRARGNPKSQDPNPKQIPTSLNGKRQNTRGFLGRLAYALLLLAPSCAGEEWAEQVARAPAGYRRLSPEEAQGLIHDYGQKGVPVLLLDVRQAAEWGDGLGRLEGATYIPHDQLGRRLEEIAAYRDELIIVVDRAGFRSRIAADYLEKAGYARLRDVDGGLLEWKRRGLPLLP